MASLKRRLQNTVLHKEYLDESNELQYSPQGVVMLYQNGVLQHEGLDYSILGMQITWLEQPLQTDLLYVYYMKNKEGANPNLGFLNIPEEIIQADLELEEELEELEELEKKLTRLKKHKENRYERLKAELEPAVLEKYQEKIKQEVNVIKDFELSISKEKLEKYKERMKQEVNVIKDIELTISEEKLKKYQERIKQTKNIELTIQDYKEKKQEVNVIDTSDENLKKYQERMARINKKEQE